MKELRENLSPACDARWHLLALINCIYEAQNPELIARFLLSRREIKEQCSHFEIPLYIMPLYPTDCLSIGYIARHASKFIDKLLILSLSGSRLRYLEIDGLTQELRKPALKHNVILSISYVPLSSRTLHVLCTIFNPYSALAGLTITCNFIKDIQLALRLILTGLNTSPLCEYLCLNQAPLSITLHLVLLLRCYHRINTLDLCGNCAIFSNPQAEMLFCEGLKYSKLKQLLLCDCKLDDTSLQVLASTITGGSLLFSLHIGGNVYTPDGFTHFLSVLLSRVAFTHLAMLSVSIINDEHRLQVNQFNDQRRFLYPGYPELRINNMDHNIIIEHQDSLRFLMQTPFLAKRSPHHF